MTKNDLSQMHAREILRNIIGKKNMKQRKQGKSDLILNHRNVRAQVKS